MVQYWHRFYSDSYRPLFLAMLSHVCAQLYARTLLALGRLTQKRLVRRFQVLAVQVEKNPA